MIGIESDFSMPFQWSVSRFEQTMVRQSHHTDPQVLFQRLIERLEAAAPEMGKDAGGDGINLSAGRSRSTRAPAAEADLL